jgi:hypothetical protein
MMYRKNFTCSSYILSFPLTEQVYIKDITRKEVPMKGQKILFSCIVLLLVAGIVSAENRGTHDVVGRDVASAGVRTVLTGNLEYTDGEWYLDSSGVLYTLHLGRYGDQADKEFKTGTYASVTGFVQGEDIAPIRVENGHAKIDFWTEERMPLWAGNGQRSNSQGQGQGQGRGNGQRLNSQAQGEGAGKNR